MDRHAKSKSLQRDHGRADDSWPCDGRRLGDIVWGRTAPSVWGRWCDSRSGSNFVWIYHRSLSILSSRSPSHWRFYRKDLPLLWQKAEKIAVYPAHSDVAQGIERGVCSAFCQGCTNGIPIVQRLDICDCHLYNPII